MAKKHIKKKTIEFIDNRISDYGWFSLDQILREFQVLQRGVTNYIEKLEEEKKIFYNIERKIYTKKKFD